MGVQSTYVKIMENTYAVRVSSSYTSEAIRDIVLNKMGGDCILFVMRSSIDTAWRINSSADGWLKSHIWKWKRKKAELCIKTRK